MAHDLHVRWIKHILFRRIADFGNNAFFTSATSSYGADTVQSDLDLRWNSVPMVKQNPLTYIRTYILHISLCVTDLHWHSGIIIIRDIKTSEGADFCRLHSVAVSTPQKQIAESPEFDSERNHHLPGAASKSAVNKNFPNMESINLKLNIIVSLESLSMVLILGCLRSRYYCNELQKHISIYFNLQLFDHRWQINLI